jgi:hypothetical protein
MGLINHTPIGSLVLILGIKASLKIKKAPALNIVVRDRGILSRSEMTTAVFGIAMS